MDQYNSIKNTYLKTIDSKYLNTLDINSFFLMLKNPTFCYKFYWLEAIIETVIQSKTETTFNELINLMIANAWYSVVEFHIHLSGYQLGEIRDGLERAIVHLKEISNLSSNATKEEILNAINQHDDELKKEKEQLTNMVPYRALSGFFNKASIRVNWSSSVQLTNDIKRIHNSILRLPYTFGDSPKLKKEVYFDPLWSEMIKDSSVSILGWIQYEKVKWLQLNNPEVPGLVYKLEPLNEKIRKLTRVHKLWDEVMTRKAVVDVFTQEELMVKEYDIDHFVPWSFVMNDELWNLMPMKTSLNSSKSNHLPRWNPFFERFALNQYLLYSLIHSDEEIHKLYESCYKDNLHSIWAIQELYRKGNTKEHFINVLEKNLRPVYDSASRQGYDMWNYHM